MVQHVDDSDRAFVRVPPSEVVDVWSVNVDEVLLQHSRPLFGLASGPMRRVQWEFLRRRVHLTLPHCYCITDFDGSDMLLAVPLTVSSMTS